MDNVLRVGFAMCGSYCTYESVFRELERLIPEFDIFPILSENASSTDSRFGTAAAHRARLETLTGRSVIDSIAKAEPIGPRKLLDVLVIAPCTGNTLAKLAHGITDSAVTMAAKAHLRNGRPVVVAVSTNDGLSGSAANIGTLLARRGYYFVPFTQDDPERKPASLVADFSRIADTVRAAMEGRQIQPVLLRA